MFEHLDDAEGSPMVLARPSEARRRAARMQARRRALAAAMAVVLVIGLGLTRMLPDDRNEADVTAVASDPGTDEDGAPDMDDGAQPDGDETPTSTTPSRAGAEGGHGPPEGGGATLGAGVPLVQEHGSTATGRVEARAVGDGSWKITVTVDGAVPDLAHEVAVQHRDPDGRLSQIRSVCHTSSDADGSFSCEGTVSFGEATEPAVVTVAGSDPRFGGYPTIGYFWLDAG
jgi:hypothetical protein